MSPSQKHKVHTTSLQVYFEGIEEGLGLQDRLALVFHEKLKPALDKEFDQIAGSDTTVVIDSLILDCGYLTGENWEEKLLQSLLEQVRKELASPSSSQKPKYFTKEAKANEMFFFFLEKGYFPWNSPFYSPYEVEKSIVINTSFLEKLNFSVLKSSFVRDRLFLSFSTLFISKIVEFISSVSNPRISQIYHYFQKKREEEVLKKLILEFLSAASKKQEIPNDALLKVLIYNTPLKSISLLPELLAPELIKDKAFQREFSKIISFSKDPEFSNKIRLLIKALSMDYPEIFKNINFPTDKKEPKSTKATLQKSPETETKRPELSSEEIPLATNQDLVENSLNSEEEIFIENAGLILLHPFIDRLLTNLRLVKNGKFEDPSHQNLAAKVLQFLVFGENELTENFFVLNKILCGMGIVEVVDLSQEISLESKKECAELLQTVLGHWTVLKNTSVEGLRETFLQRSGKLSRVDKGWKLTVERKTVDILLDKLPWGIGLVKLPWMAEMMYVDWN